MSNSRSIDTLLAAEAAHTVARLKGKVHETKALLAVLEAKLALAREDLAAAGKE
jgi:hypothetical protein